MRLSLMHKGFLLVSIPLCFEIGIFSWLLALQNDMAQESARINHSRMIGDAVNRISRRVMILEDVFKHNYNPLEVADNIRVGIDDLTLQLKRLEKYTREDPELHTMVKASLSQVYDTRRDLEGLKDQLMENFTGDPTLAAKGFGPRLRNHLRLIVSVGLLELGERSAREIDTDRTTAMREKSILLLKIAVAVSACIAAVCAWLFSQHMILRLNTVVNNAGKLGARKELSRPIGGRDEIGELDAALHNADDLISSLEQAREEIIGMVSHDIRSPLATIKATSELLKNKLDDKLDDRSRELISSIDHNCERVLRISKDLLDMQKVEFGMLTLDKESTNLKECLLSAASSTLALQRNCAVEVEPVLAALHANVDESRIEQVVTNLLTNALKYSPRGSKVILTLEETKDNQVCISVIDSGPGIPDAQKKRIFDRFKQVSEEDAKLGSGLGLAISKALVELHGGEIGVSDVSPKGSKFWFVIPRA